MSGTLMPRQQRAATSPRTQSLAVLLLVVVGFVAIGTIRTDANRPVLGTPTFTATATATPTATPTPTPTWTPTPTATPTATFTPSPTNTPTPTPVPGTPTPLPASAHLWLSSPVGPEAEGDRYPGGYFPYGATGGGKYHLHHGVDYMNPAGTAVLAVAAGTIVVAGDDLETVYGLKPNFYGNLVVEELDQKFQGRAVYVLYGHLSEVMAVVGQRVRLGDRIGRVGMTGVAIGNHLHLEVRLGANAYESSRNPVLWLKPETGQGVIAGLVLDGKGMPVPELPVTFFRAAAPNKWWRQIQTYADREVNPDEALGENFALGFVPAGDYLVKVKIGDKSYVRPVQVRAGDIAFVRIEAQK